MSTKKLLKPMFTRIAISCALVSASALPSLSLAQRQSDPLSVSVSQPGASLAEALGSFARRLDITLSFDPALVEGNRAAALHGQYTIEQGLETLLKGTGLYAEKTGNRSYVIRPPSTVGTLAPVTVTGAFEAERWNPPTTVGSKSALTQRQLAHSVSVVTQDRIVQQNLQTLDDAMRNTPGVTVEHRDNSRSIFHSRGFNITAYQMDGLPTQYDWRMLSSTDLAVYERVEVLKGTAGLYNGAAGLGGAVNLVRKRPQHEFAAEVSLSAGSWDNYRSQFDLTGPLNEAGSLRGRLVGVYQNRDFFYDKTHEEHSVLYGALSYDFTPSTTLTLGGSYQERDIHASMWSLPAYMDASDPTNLRFYLPDIKRSTFVGANWNRDQFRTSEVFAELEHRFENGWMAKLSGRYADDRLDREQAYGWGPANPVTNAIVLNSAKGPTQQKQASWDVYADGPFSLLGRKHHLTVGANFSDSRFYNEWNYPTPLWAPVIDLTDPRSDFDRLDYEFNNGNDSRTRQWGVYTNARISLADPLTLIAGGRLSWWQLDSKQTTLAGAKRQDAQYSAKFSPSIGLIYDLNDTYSVYASYTKVFLPQNGYSTEDGSLVDPLTGKQTEIGIKGEFFDGALNASLALFDVRDENRASLASDSATYYVNGGKTHNRGVELQVSGELSPGWNLYAGYTWTHARVDAGAAYDSNVTAVTPRHLFRLWTDYRLPGRWHKVTVGTGVNAQSSTYVEFPQYGGARLSQGGYATVDLKLGYDIDKHWHAALNVTNLFDRKYYQTISSPRSQNTFGEPMAVTLTLRGRY